MLTRIWTFLGTTTAVMLVALGLWGWSEARHLAAQAGRPDLALWAVRSAAAAAIAAAQVLGMSFVVAPLYPRDRAGEVIRLTAATLCTLFLIGAVALALSGR